PPLFSFFPYTTLFRSPFTSSHFSILSLDILSLLQRLHKRKPVFPRIFNVTLAAAFPIGRPNPDTLFGNGIGHSPLRPALFQFVRSEEHTSELQSRFDL